MNRWLLLIICFGISALHAAEKESRPIQEAKTRLHTGNYAEAKELYEKLSKDKSTRIQGFIGLAHTLTATGEYLQAIELLKPLADEKSTKTETEMLDLQATLAEIYYQTGNWDEATKRINTVIETNKNHFLARWLRGQILRDRGEITKADEEFRWFVRTYTERSNYDQDIKDPEELLIVGQAGAERARWHHLKDQFRFILNEIYGDVLKYDPTNWQAEYLAGSMLLEKYNRPEALSAFNKALKINPRAVAALVGKGEAALMRLEIQDADKLADQALKVNPHSTIALRLKADVHLASGELSKAQKLLDQAMAVNPKEEATLGRLAGCLSMQNRPMALQELCQQVEKMNPKPAIFYQELAHCLEDHRNFVLAEKYFKQATLLRPELTQSRSDLGMLYLRLGKETEAKELLTKAFKDDPFHTKMANSLKVLRHLEKYETVKTAHFDLRFDPSNDPLLAQMVADYLEEIHASLVKQFHYEPKERFLFELFNNHEMFSGRTIALPDLHTIGACTGRVVAMVSPQGKGLAKPFNCARVMKHELVHLFNLDQTNFQLPHWLTEGLAVRNEGGLRPTSWNRTLRDAFDTEELLNLDTIQLGFVRPRNPDQWTLAYCQSELYVDYIIKTFGEKAIGELLNAYRDGLNDTLAIEKVCHQSKVEFEKGYRKSLEPILKLIPSAKGGKEASLTLDELEKLYRANPKDYVSGGKLAEQYLRRKRSADARMLVDTILTESPDQPIASIVKAKLLLSAGDTEAAIKLLTTTLEKHPDESSVIVVLTRLQIAQEKYTEAAKLLEHGKKVAPGDADWLAQLEVVYTKLKDEEKCLPVLQEIAALDADNLKVRLRLAEVYEKQKAYPELEKICKDGLCIDIHNTSLQSKYIEALQGQKKATEAEKWSKRFQKE